MFYKLVHTFPLKQIILLIKKFIWFGGEVQFFLSVPKLNFGSKIFIFFVMIYSFLLLTK